MIAWIEGTLRDKEPLRVVIDVNGLGYELHVPLSTSAALPDVGKTVALHAHTIVREDALLLYGCATTYERDVFEMLLRANRVGPKLGDARDRPGHESPGAGRFAKGVCLAPRGRVLAGGSRLA